MAATKLAAFRALDAQVPTLSPAEESWLKREVDDELAAHDDSYSARATAAMDSREYAIRVVRSFLPSILGDLTALAQTDSLSARNEVLLWTHLGAEVGDFELWQYVDKLVALKLIDKDVDGASDYHFLNHSAFAQQITREIVLPYLSGRFK